MHDDDFDDQSFEKEFEPDLNRQKDGKGTSSSLVNVKSRFGIEIHTHTSRLARKGDCFLCAQNIHLMQFLYDYYYYRVCRLCIYIHTHLTFF